MKNEQNWCRFRGALSKGALLKGALQRGIAKGASEQGDMVQSGMAKGATCLTEMYQVLELGTGYKILTIYTTFHCEFFFI